MNFIKIISKQSKIVTNMSLIYITALCVTILYKLS